MSKRPSAKPTAKAETAPVVSAPEFTPCKQCGNPGDCARSKKCIKGFK